MPNILEGMIIKASEITQPILSTETEAQALVPKASNKEDYKYIGWENAVFQRREQDQKGFKERIKENAWGFVCGLYGLLTFRSTFRYWLLNWLSFLGLGFVSLLLSLHNLQQLNAISFVGLFASILYIIVALYTFVILGKLICGEYSYKNSKSRWELFFENLNLKSGIGSS